ncbi:hypothetical protein [Acinetobacter calcoaceticus]
MQTTIHVQDPVQISMQKHTFVKLDLILVQIILTLLICIIHLYSALRSIKSFIAYVCSFSFVGYVSVYVILSALSFLFVIFVVDANEIEQEGRFKANEHYFRLVEANNPEGIFISE